MWSVDTVKYQLNIGKELKLIFKMVIRISRIDKFKCNRKENNGCKEKTDSK
jgi:hypothetical protein